MCELMANDPKIVALTAAMPDGTGVDRVLEKFPERAFDVGIAEQHAITFCAGMACEGLKPVAAIYSTFLQRAFDQVIHDVCLQDLNVTIAMDRAGIVGADGRHITGSWILLIPGLSEYHFDGSEGRSGDARYASDGDRASGTGCFEVSARQWNRRRHKRTAEKLEIGKGEVVREGKDVALVAYGTMVNAAVEAAERLSATGVRATVVNARFVKPLDEELMVRLAAEHQLIVTIEEAYLAGGFGSAVLEVLEANGLLESTTLVRMGVPDEIVTHGDPKALLAAYGLNADGIAARLMPNSKRPTGKDPGINVLR
jgi:1-deoxy-D-xylulose-5-phosphate synthase